MERAELAAFLRARRAALHPEDVGLPPTRRRRTQGLRREEIAHLANISTDYYSRMEQRRGPRPSEPVLAAIAHGLRLTPDERDHLFRLAGHPAPTRPPHTDTVNPGMRAVFDRVTDTPAQIVNRLGETLLQNRPATLLLGDHRRHTGLARALAYRWFTDPAERDPFPTEDHPRHSRTLTAQLLAAHTHDSTNPRLSTLVGQLLQNSAEFAELWHEHPVIGPYCAPKRIEHPQVGLLELHGQSLVDPDQSQLLMVFTAAPGTVSDARLQSLTSTGTTGAAAASR